MLVFQSPSLGLVLHTGDFRSKCLTFFGDDFFVVVDGDCDSCGDGMLVV